jgi:methyl-accepting chemotaxis protein
MTPDDAKPEQFEEVLTSVAESIGSTLGNIAAKANAAKEALTPSPATQRKVVAGAKEARRNAEAITRKVAKKVSAGAKKVSASAKRIASRAKKAKKAATKTAKKAKKATRKTVKKAKRRLGK